MSSNLSRTSLSTDLDHLQSLSVSLASILDHHGVNQPTAPSTSASATAPSEVLSSFSPSTAGVGESQKLTSAYIASMGDVRALDRGGETDVVGERIDGLRERGEGLGSVLGEVRM